jgi:glycosyltransferase involved in cell wall biosynthesis
MFTIITVCLNSEQTIQRTIESVLSQTYPIKEYIIIDGVSTDNTCQIILKNKPLFEKKGIRLKFISEKDNGLYDAMNKGLKLATQEWVHFLNSDDYYINQYVLSSISKIISTQKENVIYGKTITENKNGQFVQYDIREKHIKLNMLFGCPISQPATFFRTNHLKKNYSFDTTYKICADYKLFVEMINKKESFKFIHQYITVFNLEGISNQHKESIALEEDIRLLKECHHTSFFIRLKKRKKIFKTLLLFIEFLSRF